MKRDKWHNLYNDSWQGEIVPEAFAHPAKMSYGLLQRIYDHCFEQGWLKEGDVVVDPFGGIGSTGILGAYRGVQVVSCELEAKFTGLAMHNMFLHLPKWRALGSPLPVIIQGDSRKLCELVNHTQKRTVSDSELDGREGRAIDALMAAAFRADLVVSSPPYSATVKDSPNHFSVDWSKTKRDGDTRGQSPHGQGRVPFDYGHTPGQLGSMKAGSVEAVISSPPYAESGAGKQGGQQRGSPGDGKQLCGPGDAYGSTPGNLGNLKPGSVADCIVSSPPYEGSLTTANKQNDLCPHDSTARYERKYGDSQGQLGQEQGPTFWAAAKEIVQQCYQILKQGGHAVWVVKDFVRKGQKVDFTGDWRRLCEAAGFETACVHHAMLVKESKHKTLFGHTHTEITERKSFFRRLAEAKGCPPINYETVLCMRKRGCE